jgi:glyoxylase-like metal-dependent hydrolase (beta-lactamase superfamily II)
MRIHHLNCASFCPHGGARIVNGRGRIFSKASLVTHCLLIETPRGLVLVDTGLGLEDLQNPKQRIGRGFVNFFKPQLIEKETALRQIEALGFGRSDVRHIILTHLDPDHAGGISDFPEANVHIFRLEHEAAVRRLSMLEKRRYRPLQWAHHQRWQLHNPPEGGERWKGFEAVRSLAPDLSEILIIPLPGHTRGHCGVAVREGDGWLLHAGDAYFHHSEINPKRPRCPKALDVFQRIVAHDNSARLENQARLRALAAQPASDVRIFCAHDPMELYRERAFFNTP